MGNERQNDAPHDLLKEVVDHYETADRFVREVAFFRGKVVIPALNELRYAGHHVIQCISPETGQVTNVNNNLRKGCTSGK
jgi:hypothetical protein